MENPYRPPLSPLDVSVSIDPFPRRPGLVRHVRVVAILSMVQAGFELLAAAGFAAMAALLAAIGPQLLKQPHATNQPDIGVLILIYGAGGAAALIAGILHLVAGVRSYRFRGRTFGIVAAVCGLVDVALCCCLPTSAALALYGMIVYLNPEVSEAFRMGEAGCAPDEIVAAFLGQALR